MLQLNVPIKNNVMGASSASCCFQIEIFGYSLANV